MCSSSRSIMAVLPPCLDCSCSSLAGASIHSSQRRHALRVYRESALPCVSYNLLGIQEFLRCVYTQTHGRTLVCCSYLCFLALLFLSTPPSLARALINKTYANRMQAVFCCVHLKWMAGRSSIASSPCMSVWYCYTLSSKHLYGY